MLATNDRVRPILKRVEAKANAQRGAELVDAVCKRDYRQTVVLLASDVSPNTMSDEGDSLLHLAVQRDDHKVLDALLRAPDIKIDVCNSVSETEIEMDISSPLGAGGYGAVYKGIYNDRSVAVKTAANASSAQALVYEMETMQMCNSPYVLQLLAVSGAGTSSPKLVLEYMDAGDLRSYLDAKRLGRATKVDVSSLEVAWVLANALADLHHNGLLHRDLKSHNARAHRTGLRQKCSRRAATTALPPISTHLASF
ncbi:serine/threonine protein kinase [Saprolegnia diclina VS20]|uniref:Serine/threonine protein kinase n=1 Tax=Saprolegnia diclina (strain VS20) TaxID=1156394 RepID=T0PWP8_SAPDV|nr:serine/threonine protein kinase [Saprolegnia diclina VS20]EQC25440.1 serine/threonine protein kinase [Saprolegnia diclina VS20]|eukprot:XP_008621126.1 serine/threonine protein kinase [Saprolegnia diclina VS20]